MSKIHISQNFDMIKVLHHTPGEIYSMDDKNQNANTLADRFRCIGPDKSGHWEVVES